MAPLIFDTAPDEYSSSSSSTNIKPYHLRKHHHEQQKMKMTGTPETSPSSSQDEDEVVGVRRRVRFSDYSEMFYVPSVDELSEEEFFGTYMTEFDFIRIEMENNDTLRTMRRGKYPGTTERYFRGLEVLLPKRQAERKQQTVSVVKALLEAQAACGGSGFLTPSWIQHIQSLSANSAAVAYAMGIWDAEANVADLQADAKEARRKQERRERRERRKRRQERQRNTR